MDETKLTGEMEPNGTTERYSFSFFTLRSPFRLSTLLRSSLSVEPDSILNHLQSRSSLGTLKEKVVLLAEKEKFTRLIQN